MSKFSVVTERETNGINYDVTTEDIVEKLEKWDSEFGIEISDVDHCSVVVKFSTLPAKLMTLGNEIYEFCPDVIDQGFGCMDDMVEMAEEVGQELPEDVQVLIQGIDFNDENFGLELLVRSLSATKSVSFWWD